MKSYTDLEQSRKLAEILPLESADMYFTGHQSIVKPKEWEYENVPKIKGKYISFDDKRIFYPCWSIATLMSVFPKEEGSCVSISYGYYDANGNYVSSWLCCYEKEGESTDDYIIETIPADNPIDCCYEMILKLKEKGLL